MPEATAPKAKNLGLSAPVKLNETHDFSAFECGQASIDAYVKRALKAQAAKDAVIYVICRNGTLQVLGFYTLTNGAVMRDQAPKKLQRNAPNQYPVTVLGRLGVDRTIQGQGVAIALLQDAIERSIAASEAVGSRALLVHALDLGLADFYKKYAGFIESPVSPLTLMLPLQ